MKITVLIHMMKILKDKTFSKIHQKTGTEVSFVKFRKRFEKLWDLKGTTDVAINFFGDVASVSLVSIKFNLLK